MQGPAGRLPARAVTAEEVYRREMEQRGRWHRTVAEAHGIPEVFPQAPLDSGFNLKHNVQAIERITIRAALRETEGHRKKAAALLGVPLYTLVYLLRTRGVQ
jgi:transcriptional regulator with GAF, ATPase, and Fis domain